MIASLPMYDWPEIREATDQWWAGIARHMSVHADLWRSEDFQAAWSNPDLMFSQTCGYPFTHAFRGQLQLVATPHYAAAGCEGPNYCSFIFTRNTAPIATFRGAKAAINGMDSMSGMLALKLAVGENDFFGSEIITGSHIASLQAVQTGEADICAIDAICVALARRHRPELLKGLNIISASPQVPGLPYVTRQNEVSKLRHALKNALADPELQHARETLLIAGASELPVSAYDIILKLENDLRHTRLNRGI
jgi:ABC-type phosphate/phosphonate transport system substrate-binding protein